MNIARLLFGFLLLASQICVGLDNGPEISRICLDNNTSIATLYWHSPIDNCSSFSCYKIYSSENNGPWVKKKTIYTISTNQLPLFISDLTSDWRFKIVTYSACNGIDSFISNPQSIDQNKPSLIELDSVSFDYPSQHLSAGWKKNPAVDTKGYWLYNYLSPVYDKILDTEKLCAIMNNYDKSNPSKIAIATYDSCDNFAPISSAQQPAYLSGIIDTCAKSISLNWSTYQGWSNISQNIIVNLNGSGFSSLVSVTPVTTNYTISNITLGNNLCYYIRTENLTTKATSSSNTICFQTRKFKTPTTNYLSNITIENNALLKGSFIIDNKADIDSIFIEKKGADLLFTPFQQIIFNPYQSVYSFEDLSADFNNNIYSYRITTKDKCKNITSISNIGSSILLSKPILKENLYKFQWNLYNGWEKGVASQTVELSLDRFTWNLSKNETSNETIFNYSSENMVSDSICFRINDLESFNSYNISSTSTSNIQCIYNIGHFFFPETINPYSNNNVFKIYGVGANPKGGVIEIFNRWGEKIFVTDNLIEGWDGKINGDFVMQGSYIYKATFYDQANKFYLKTGSILIIR